jgi:tripartite-type tricarboxylate transporter receptor subunit TctC
MKRREVLTGLGALPLASLGTTASTTWPTKPVHIIVPYPAGNATDALARLISAELSGPLNQPVVVENVAGGGGLVGIRRAIRSANDGHTLVVTPSGVLCLLPAIHKTPPYDLADLTPVGMVAPLPFVLLVNPAIPANTVQELLELARKQPGKLPYASLGPTSGQRLAMEMLMRPAGVSMLHVPYAGSSQAKTDLLGGRISVMFDVLSASLPLVKEGKLRALATSGSKRSSLAPNIPTVAESGIPGYESSAWTGLMAPAGTPPEIIARLNREISRILNSPEAVTKAIRMGMELTPSTPREFGDHILLERAKWSKIIQEVGIEKSE